jgi:hypothetical protein
MNLSTSIGFVRSTISTVFERIPVPDRKVNKLSSGLYKSIDELEAHRSYVLANLRRRNSKHLSLRT